MTRQYSYKIPRNMNHPDKVWSNGTYYLSWVDVALSFGGIILIIALTYLVKNILLLILSIVLVMLVCAVLMFWKPWGWPLYKIAFYYLLNRSRPAVWRDEDGSQPERLAGNSKYRS